MNKTFNKHRISRPMVIIILRSVREPLTHRFRTKGRFPSVHNSRTLHNLMFTRRQQFSRLMNSHIIPRIQVKNIKHIARPFIRSFKVPMQISTRRLLHITISRTAMFTTRQRARMSNQRTGPIKSMLSRRRLINHKRTMRNKLIRKTYRFSHLKLSMRRMFTGLHSLIQTNSIHIPMIMFTTRHTDLSRVLPIQIRTRYNLHPAIRSVRNNNNRKFMFSTQRLRRNRKRLNSNDLQSARRHLTFIHLHRYKRPVTRTHQIRIRRPMRSQVRVRRIRANTRRTMHLAPSPHKAFQVHNTPPRIRRRQVIRHVSLAISRLTHRLKTLPQLRCIRIQFHRVQFQSKDR